MTTIEVVGQLMLLNQVLSGTFTVTEDVGALGEFSIAASGVGVSLSSGSTRIIELGEGSGELSLSARGLSGTLSLNLVAGPEIENLALQGNAFTIEIHTGDETFITESGAKWMPGLFVQVSQGSLSFLDQDLTGDFLIRQDIQTSTQLDLSTNELLFTETSVVTLAVSEAQVVLRNGANALLTLRDGSGSFLFTETGFAGEASVSVDADLAEDLEFAGTFTLAVNTLEQSVNEHLNVGAVSVSLILPAGPYIRLSGNSVTLRVGQQSLSGNFSLECLVDKDSTLIRGGMSGVNVFLGTGAGTDDEQGFRISEGRGAMLITDAGVALEAGGAIALVGFEGLSLTAEQMTVQVNTMSEAVSEEIVTGEYDAEGAEVTVSLEVEANMFRFRGDNVSLTVAVAVAVAGVTLSGSFAVERFTETSTQFDPTSGQLSFVESSVTVLAISDFSVDLGPVKLEDGNGVFVVGGGGFAGEASVRVSVPGSDQFSFSGTFGLAFKTTSEAVNRRVTVGGESVSLVLPEGSYIRVSGTNVQLNVFGQSLSGNFSLERLEANDGSILIRGGVSGINVLLGTEDEINGKTGVEIRDARGALIMSNSGMALKATGSVEVFGIPEVTFAVEQLSVEINTSDDLLEESVETGEFDANGDPVTVDINLAADTFRFSGDMILEVSEFFYVSGSFAIEKTQDTMTLSDGEQVTIDLLTIGAADVNVFAGVNGPYDFETPSNTPDVVGFVMQGMNFGLALMSSAVVANDPNTAEDESQLASDRRSWTALRASVASAEFVGFDDGTLAVSNVLLAVNRGSGSNATVENTTVVDVSGEAWKVCSGGERIVLDFGGADGAAFQVEATVELAVSDFFFVNGNFAFEKKSLSNVVLDDGSMVDVEVLTVGASDVKVFAGINGSGDLNSLSESALGLKLGGVDLALALMKVKVENGSTDKRSWTALKANATMVELVGVENMPLELRNLAVKINRGGGTFNGANTTTVDFDPDVLTVNTGGGNSIDLDFDGPLLEVSGDLTLTIDDFVYMWAAYVFQALFSTM